MDANLKECPFCGSAPRHLEGKNGFYTERVICDTCDFYLSPLAWGERSAIAPPVAAGSMDTAELRLMLIDHRHSDSRQEQDQHLDSIISFVIAWGAQQREQGYRDGLELGSAGLHGAIETAKKAEAELKKRDLELIVSHGETDAALQRATLAEARVKELQGWLERSGYLD